MEEQALERVSTTTADNWETLFSLSLPEPDSLVALLAATMDPDQKALTFSSLNPNLRGVGHSVQQVQLASGTNGHGPKVNFIGYAINFGTHPVRAGGRVQRTVVRARRISSVYGLLKRVFGVSPASSSEPGHSRNSEPMHPVFSAMKCSSEIDPRSCEIYSTTVSRPVAAREPQERSFGSRPKNSWSRSSWLRREQVRPT